MLEPVYEEHARLVAARVAELLRGRAAVVQEYVGPEEASIILGISIRTLENYRVRGDGGPPFSRLGRIVRYKVADLHAWMEVNRIQR